MLARHRNPPQRRATVQRQTGNTIRDDKIALHGQFGGSQAIAPDCSRLASPHVLALTGAVRKLLQDIYFSCQFHSSLLFHRPTFDKALDAGDEASHTVLALYANATMYELHHCFIVYMTDDSKFCAAWVQNVQAE